MRDTSPLRLTVIGGFLALLVACTPTTSLPTGEWSSLTQEEKGLRLDHMVSIAEGTKSRNAVREEAERILFLFPEPAPAPLHPPLERLLKLCVEKNLPEMAGQVREKMGQFRQAALLARESGDLDKAAEMLDRLQEQENLTPETLAGERSLLADGWMTEAEKALQDATKARSISKMERTRRGYPSSSEHYERAKECLDKAAEQLTGLPSSSESRVRLLGLRFDHIFHPTNPASKPSQEARDLALEQASSLELGENSAQALLEAWLPVVIQALKKQRYEVADIFLTRLLKVTEDKPLPQALQELLPRLRISTAFRNARFSEARELAQKAMTLTRPQQTVLDYAVNNPGNFLRESRFPFPESKRTDVLHSYVSLFSPGDAYLEEGATTRYEAPGDEILAEFVSYSKSDGVKVHANFRQEKSWFCEFVSGYRRPFTTALYEDARKPGTGQADPQISYESGHFVVLEIEWSTEQDKDKRVARFAVDFVGSPTERISDMVYGRVRYNSHFE